MPKKIRRKKGRWLIPAALSLAAVCMAAWLLNSWIRPVVEVRMANQAKSTVTMLLHEVVAQTLADEQVRYDTLIRLSTDSAGAVTAIRTDTVAVNRLKSALAAAVTARLVVLEGQSFSVHLGTLLGGQVLFGRGPRVPFRVAPVGVVTLKLRHTFQTASINQTYHRVTMDVAIEMVASLPIYQSAFSVETEVVLGESVLVGAVPEFFGDFSGTAGLVP